MLAASAATELNICNVRWADERPTETPCSLTRSLPPTPAGLGASHVSDPDTVEMYDHRSAVVRVRRGIVKRARPATTALSSQSNACSVTCRCLIIDRQNTHS